MENVNLTTVLSDNAGNNGTTQCPHECHSHSLEAFHIYFPIITFALGFFGALFCLWAPPIMNSIGDAMITRSVVKKLNCKTEDEAYCNELGTSEWYKARHKQIVAIIQHYIRLEKDEEAEEKLRQEYLADIAWKPQPAEEGINAEHVEMINVRFLGVPGLGTVEYPMPYFKDLSKESQAEEIV